MEIINTMRGKDYAAALEGATERALVAIGIFLEGEAVVRVPIDTGRLKGSITYATKKEADLPGPKAKFDDKVSRPSKKQTLHVGTNVEYAQHVEYGTVRSGAQPYLRPALNDNRRRIVEIFKEEVHKGLESGRE